MGMGENEAWPIASWSRDPSQQWVKPRKTVEKFEVILIKNSNVILRVKLQNVHKKVVNAWEDRSTLKRAIKFFEGKKKSFYDGFKLFHISLFVMRDESGWLCLLFNNFELFMKIFRG